MSDMKVIDLSEAQNRVEESLGSQKAELQEYELGEIVSVEDDGAGIVAAYVDSAFTWPSGLDEDEAQQLAEEEDFVVGATDEGDLQMEPPAGERIYIVALMDGGSVPALADQISGDASIEDDDGEDVESWTDVQGAADETELAPIYAEVDSPDDMEEFRAAQKRMIQQSRAEELADYAEGNDVSLDELDEYSVEELVNIPGVDDPHVGFDELPPGWNRKSVLQAWASLGGMWRTCYARMVREFGPRMAKRWCSALKDEVLRTERWRNRF